MANIRSSYSNYSKSLAILVSWLIKHWKLSDRKTWLWWHEMLKHFTGKGERIQTEICKLDFGHSALSLLSSGLVGKLGTKIERNDFHILLRSVETRKSLASNIKSYWYDINRLPTLELQVGSINFNLSHHHYAHVLLYHINWIYQNFDHIYIYSLFVILQYW